MAGPKLYVNRDGAPQKRVPWCFLKFSICRNKIAWCTWHCKPCKRRWLWSGQDQTWHQRWRKACRMKDKSATHRINGNFEIFDDFAAATLGTKISSPSHGWLGNSHVRRTRREKTQRMLIRSTNHPESILNPVVWPSFYLFVFVRICLNLWLEVFIYLLCRHEEPIGHTPRPSCSSFSRLSRRGTCEPRWRGGTERTSGFSWYSAVDLVAICDAHCFVKSFGIFTCLTCHGVHAHCLLSSCRGLGAINKARLQTQLSPGRALELRFHIWQIPL